jgi:hypothetical protein
VKSKPTERYRCEAEHTNLIWHTDLHRFHHGEWVIAQIDDRSRLCLAVKFLRDQSSIQTAEALCEILS